MDARLLRLAIVLLAWILAAPIATAAQWRTPNFVVTAPTEELAKKVAFTAEQWRVRLAKEWLGRELPNWYKPCPIQVKVGQIGAGGATTFNFDRGQVFGWRMNVQGTEERILDSVIPHEVSHTVFASHFRRPLPRWADEGAATLAEHESEQRRQDLHLKQVWNSHKIPLKSLLSMTEYPSDMRDVMTLYAQGYSIADYLVQKGGKARYLEFLDVAENEGWEKALKGLYGIDGISSLEKTWGNWVLAGSPDLPSDSLIASNEQSRRRDADVEIRAQTPDADPSEVIATQPRRSEPGRTAARGGDDTSGFLPPRRTASQPVEAESTAPASRKEPRPAPLGPYTKPGPDRRGTGATETSAQQTEPGRRSLPRTSRVEPTASRSQPLDFFQTVADERTGAPRRTLGANDFPMASAF